MDNKTEIENKIKKLEQELNQEKVRLNNIKKEEKIKQMKESLPPGFSIKYVTRREPIFDNYYRLEHISNTRAYTVASHGEDKGEEEAVRVLTEYARNIYNTTVYYANYLDKFIGVNVLENFNMDCPWSKV